MFCSLFIILFVSNKFSFYWNVAFGLLKTEVDTKLLPARMVPLSYARVV